MQRAGRAAATLVLACALAASGCSSLKPLVADLTGKPVGEEPAKPAQQPAVPPLPDSYSLEVRGPEPLRSELAQHLDLARFRDARVAGAVTRLELDRLIAAAPAQARSIAETDGYFNAEVTVTRDRAEFPNVLVVVVPGPRARIADVGLGLDGALLAAMRAGDESAIDLAASLLEQWPLHKGLPFTQEGWASAKAETLARLQAQGYPAARLRDSSAIVDAESGQVRLHIDYDSGPLFRLGRLDIVGLARYDETAVHNLLDFTPGEPYTEALLARWQRRLQKSELFQAAIVELEADPAQADAATVLVKLTEMPRQQTTIGLGYSTDTGARATLDYMHRSPFGLRMVASNKLEIGNQKNAWTGQLISYPLPDHYRDLASVDLERLDQNDEVRTSAGLRLGRNQDTEDRLCKLLKISKIFAMKII